MRNLILLTLAGLVVFALWQFGPRRVAAPEAIGLPGGVEQQLESDTAELNSLTPVPSNTARDSVAVSGGGSAAALEPAAALHPWDGEFAGIRGRVVEEDGSPVGDIDVELVEFGFAFLLNPAQRVTGREGIRLARTRTGIDGRFELAGARPAEYHALAVDGGGARSTLRALEHSLSYSRVTDIGDLVLQRGGTVVGRAVDQEGEPVARVRVRFAEMPGMVVESGALDLRAASLPVQQTADGLLPFELPGWVSALVDDLPISTTWTDTDGRFRLEGVVGGPLAGGLDRAGFTATLVPSFSLASGEVLDLGDIELSPGRTATGRVTDASGGVVEGATVLAGAIHPALGVGFFQPSVTDLNGGFASQGVGADGDVAVLARRSEHDPWVSSGLSREPSGLNVVLPRLERLQVTLVTPEGAPVPGATISLFPSQESDDDLQRLLAIWQRQGPRLELSPGSMTGEYAVERLAFGAYEAVVDAPGFAVLRRRLVHGKEGGQHRFVLPLGAAVPLRVVDGMSGEPVEHARVSIIAQEEAHFGSLTDAWTGADGTAGLGPVPTTLGVASQNTAAAFPLRHPVFAVEHPAYGHHSQPFEVSWPLSSEGSTEGLTISLWPPATLRGTVRWGDDVPSERYAVTLERLPSGGREEESFNEAPRRAMTDSDGLFVVTGVATGHYTLSLAEPLFQMDFLHRVTERRWPSVDYRQSIEVQSGVANTVDIQLSAAGVAAPGWVEGSVWINGQPLVGAQVSARNFPPEVVLTDASGSFVMSPMDRADVNISVDSPFDLPDGSSEMSTIYDEFVHISHGQASRIDLRFSTSELDVTVRDADTGKPVKGARVHSAARWLPVADKKTNEDGLVTLTIRRGENTTVSVFHPAYPTEHVPLSGSALESGQPLEIALRRGVPCSGRAIAPEGLEFGVDCAVALASKGSELRPNEAYLIIEKDTHTFTKRGLTPGSYTATLIAVGRVGRPVTFELPEEGATDLLLDFKSGTSR